MSPTGAGISTPAVDTVPTGASPESVPSRRRRRSDLLGAGGGVAMNRLLPGRKRRLVRRSGRARMPVEVADLVCVRCDGLCEVSQDPTMLHDAARMALSGPVCPGCVDEIARR
ncbi:hypothetical protein HBB16_05215 [Pseudonocardia sp. MCCB 268]|nr:hypothetical protein [Pseudonocardia cytotoxica]